MHKIESAPFGFRVTSSGFFAVDDIERLKLDLLQTLSEHNRPFSLLLDSRELIPPPPDVMKEFWDLHAKVWQLSCERIVFVVSSPVAKAQVLQMHCIASSGKKDRVIDASKYPDWEEIAVAWVADAVEPEESSVLSQDKLC
jgi:hypothetical protein